MARELIVVEAEFSKDDILVPLAFLRSGRKFRVLSIGRTELVGNVRRYLVTVENNQVFEIGYDLNRNVWALYRSPKDFHPNGGRV